MFESNFDKNFKKWIPHQNVDEVYDMENVGFERDEGFVVLLVPDHFEKDKRSEYNLKLVWDYVISYTVTDESYRPEMWKTKEDSNNEIWTFYISESSDYLNKFREENYLVAEKTYHFFICGTNLMIDIISEEYPKVTFVKQI
ncbi:hypothetical protein SAMN02745784_02210 [Tissierella praeacuta DSM 18095]|uniref:Uncharacterized protein n=1 Tax=Tissierella praeacuta DSM 18095 TaxID=1123404 RepID=A0A1M4XE84_9FIRM|nr:hypothetical protein [Tissierella praeacuta]TCU67762.1 hypothetical protein EV204_1115 [Tissierella praeacuta]SHE91824.1 hypothetical protein SAMN02745784_02210 [Tissierella praeacuta DSM 18095]SUP02217.1 Uncharacterised protein [Tissierella praeacuta]